MKKKSLRLARTIEGYYRQIGEESADTGIEFQGLRMPNRYGQMVDVAPSQVREYLRYMKPAEQEVMLRAVISFHESLVMVKTQANERR